MIDLSVNKYTIGFWSIFWLWAVIIFTNLFILKNDILHAQVYSIYKQPSGPKIPSLAKLIQTKKSDVYVVSLKLKGPKFIDITVRKKYIEKIEKGQNVILEISRIFNHVRSANINDTNMKFTYTPFLDGIFLIIALIFPLLQILVGDKKKSFAPIFIINLIFVVYFTINIVK